MHNNGGNWLWNDSGDADGDCTVSDDVMVVIMMMMIILIN